MGVNETQILSDQSNLKWGGAMFLANCRLGTGTQAYSVANNNISQAHLSGVL